MIQPHSFVPDLDLFSTTHNKLDFLQGYVVKYEHEFSSNSFDFNNYSCQFADLLDKDDSDDDGDEPYEPINITLPPRDTWKSIPVVPREEFYKRDRVANAGKPKEIAKPKEITPHSFVEDINLFSTPLGKLEFLQNFVIKYPYLFFPDPVKFDELCTRLK